MEEDEQIPFEESTLAKNLLSVRNLSRPRFIHDLNNSPAKSFKRANHRTKSRRQARGTELLTLENFKFTDKIINMTEEEGEELECKIVELEGNKIYGNWKNGKLHGKCKIQYQSGEYFEGKYEYGIRVQGLLRFKDGSQFRGRFSEENFHGPGIITDPGKRQISCYWNKGVPGKRGRIEYPGGDIYIGELGNLKKHGKGTIYFKNGEKFIGNFQDGHIDGPGEYISGNKKILEGFWKNGFLQIDQKTKEILRETLQKHISDNFTF